MAKLKEIYQCDVCKKQIESTLGRKPLFTIGLHGYGQIGNNYFHVDDSSNWHDGCVKNLEICDDCLEKAGFFVITDEYGTIDEKKSLSTAEQLYNIILKVVQENQPE